MNSIRLVAPATQPAERESRGASSRDWVFESVCNSHNSKPIERLVGASSTMVELRSRITRYAKTEAPVLICGESGTGKELIAKIIHDVSSRNCGPFVAINCAAIPSQLAESELFGSAKGAFTGAIRGRAGLLSKANGGTLFLDEFGELAPEVQSKMLRVLDNGTYFPVGANKETCADFRIVTATNRDLERSVLQGEFRADLYHRVNVLQLTAPPLRKHTEDIPQIARAILGEFLPKNSNLKITEKVMSQLLEAPWHGNVRELRNVLRRSLVMSRGETLDRLECDHCLTMPSAPAAQNESPSTDCLRDSLMRNKGHLTAVAHELNVSVRTVQRRMKERGFKLRDFQNL